MSGIAEIRGFFFLRRRKSADLGYFLGGALFFALFKASTDFLPRNFKIWQSISASNPILGVKDCLLKRDAGGLVADDGCWMFGGSALAVVAVFLGGFIHTLGIISWINFCLPPYFKGVSRVKQLIIRQSLPFRQVFFFCLPAPSGQGGRGSISTHTPFGMKCILFQKNIIKRGFL